MYRVNFNSRKFSNKTKKNKTKKNVSTSMITFILSLKARLPTRTFKSSIFWEKPTREENVVLPECR